MDERRGDSRADHPLAGHANDRHRVLASAWHPRARPPNGRAVPTVEVARSEEHTSELQSHVNLVCRLLLEKKKKKKKARETKKSVKKRYIEIRRGRDIISELSIV